MTGPASGEASNTAQHLNILCGPEEGIPTELHINSEQGQRTAFPACFTHLISSRLTCTSPCCLQRALG